MIKEAIILAGGLGTRLRSVVSDVPKCMAPVNGKPFLYYVIEQLVDQGIDSFIFAVGYKSELIIDYVQAHYPNISKQFSVETEPLGTGGAIKLACKCVAGKHVFILNGDTLFKIDMEWVSTFHDNNNADCTLSLKPMENFDRYGVVDLNEDSSIACFNEKKYYEWGLINGGMYVINVPQFIQEELPQKCSFEKDYLEMYYNKRRMFGIIQDEYFIDIGIPEDFEKAQRELKTEN